MARLMPIGHLTARQAIWTAIRDLAPAGSWGVDEVAARSDVDLSSVRRYVADLIAAGLVASEPGADRRSRRCTLCRDLGVEAPRIRAGGEIITEPTNQEKIWAAMKSLREFTAVDLVVATGVNRRSCANYLMYLARAGYLVRCGRRGAYRLRPSRNTGPRPPAVRADRSVYDLNLGREMRP